LGLPAEVVGEMSSRELTEWAAFEQVNGPILVHERIDIGLAQIGLIMAKLWGKGNPRPRDFLPVWYGPTVRDDDGSILGAMLEGLAKNGGAPSPRLAS
jgi:hypothetical protein